MRDYSAVAVQAHTAKPEFTAKTLFERFLSG